MRIHNSVLQNDPDNHTEVAPLEFKQTYVALFLRRSIRVRDRQSVVDASTIPLSIISIQVFIAVKNSSKSLLVVTLLVSSSALQLLGIPLCLDTHMIWISYRSANLTEIYATTVPLLGVHCVGIQSPNSRLAVKRYDSVSF